MERFIIQLYGEISDELNERIHSDLNYYMYETEEKSEIFYYKIYENSIIIVISDDTTHWNYNTLILFLRIIFKNNNYFMNRLSSGSYQGWLDNEMWDIMRGDNAKELFENPKEYRKKYNRQKKVNFFKKNILNKHIEGENIDLRNKNI